MVRYYKPGQTLVKAQRAQGAGLIDKSFVQTQTNPFRSETILYVYRLLLRDSHFCAFLQVSFRFSTVHRENANYFEKYMSFSPFRMSLKMTPLRTTQIIISKNINSGNTNFRNIKNIPTRKS